MTTFNTGNPLGSTDPRDLYDNAENLDNLVNGEQSAYNDRLGQSRKSWAGMESEFAAFIAASGYEFLGDYAAGIEITGYQQVVRDISGEFWRLSGSVTLPYTTTGAGLPEGGAFVAVGDAVLRQELNANTPGQGSDLIAHTGTSDTVTEALDKRTIYVGSVAELEALSLPVGTNVYLTQEGRAGPGVIKSGTPPTDPQKGVNIVLANGNYWMRQYDSLSAEGGLNVKWFGAVGDTINDDSVAFSAAIAYAESLDNGTRSKPTVTVPAGQFNLESTVVLNEMIKLRGSGNASVLMCNHNGVAGIQIFERGATLEQLTFRQHPSSLDYQVCPDNLINIGEISVTAAAETLIDRCVFEGVGAKEVIVNNSRSFNLCIRDAIFHNVRANTATVAFRQNNDEGIYFSYRCSIENTTFTRSYLQALGSTGNFGDAVLIEGGQVSINNTVMQSNRKGIMVPAEVAERPVISLNEVYFEFSETQLEVLNGGGASPAIKISGARAHATVTRPGKWVLNYGDINIDTSEIFQLVEFETTTGADIVLGPGNSRWVYQNLGDLDQSVVTVSPTRVFSVDTGANTPRKIIGVSANTAKSFLVSCTHRSGPSGDNAHTKLYLLNVSDSGAVTHSEVSSSRIEGAVASVDWIFYGQNGGIYSEISQAGNWRYKVIG